MKKQIQLFLILIAGMMLWVSCDSNPSSVNDAAEDFRSMRVPGDFDYNTTKDIEITVEKAGISEDVVVRILSDHPSRAGKTIQRGLLKGSSTGFKLNIPGHLSEVWVSTKVANEITRYQKVSLDGGNSFSVEAGVDMEPMSGISPADAPAPSGCDAGCTRTITNGENNLTADGGEVICIPEDVTYSGNLTIRGDAEIRVCGVLDIQNVNTQNFPAPTIEVNPSGSIEAQNFNINNSNSLVVNHGYINFKSNMGLGYKIHNYGEIDVPGLNINSGGEVKNGGILNVDRSLNNNQYMENTGTINVGDDYNNNGEATAINECRINVDRDFNQNTGNFTNNGYIKVDRRTRFNGGSNTEFGEGALIDADDVAVNGSVFGQESAYGRMNVTSQMVINGGGSVTGLMDICAELGIRRNNGTIGEGVTYCDAFIPATDCNPGAGDNTGADEDSDGIPDDQDDYPGDPSKAFNNHYPDVGTFGTLAYEDLWPSLGDYDMNDLVLDYQINEITNADNEIVEIDFTYVIRAIGATIDSGFGIELPLPSAAVSGVDGARLNNGLVTTNGNGTEAGQTNAVIIITDDATENMGRYVNTVNPASHVTEDTLSVTVSLSSPVTREQLGNPPYNPFIFINEERGREVHLPGKNPTDLADTGLFGTAADDTDISAGRSYKSEGNLNWAINVPVSIPYPLEQEDMTQVYLNFASWAQSGGSENTDWYMDLPGNREESLLYIRPSSEE
jgi:LruC domain-containing protein